MTRALTIETAQQNIGEEVIFLGNTKPYTSFLGKLSNQEKRFGFRIQGVNLNGDVHLVAENGIGFNINPKHLALVNITPVELSVKDVIKAMKGDCTTLPSWVQSAYHNNTLYSFEGYLFIKSPCRSILNVSEGIIIPHEKDGFVTWLDKDEQEAINLKKMLCRNSVQDATHIGGNTQVFSLKYDNTTFLFLNGKWVECAWLDDEFIPVTLGIDVGADEDTNENLVDHQHGTEVSEDKVHDKKEAFSEYELDLRERIAMTLLDIHGSTDDLDEVFKAVMGK